MAAPPVNDPSVIEQAITGTGPIAIVGLSNNPTRDSYRVAKYLIDYGFDVIPVNPTAENVLGRRTFPSVTAIPGKVAVVDIFRRPDEVEPIVDEAIKKGARIVWMQLGSGNDEGARKALVAGLGVVMDRCMKIEHQRRALAIAKGQKR
jgi:uncharacterized protein